MRPAGTPCGFATIRARRNASIAPSSAEPPRPPLVPYRILDHTADVGLVVQGESESDLFQNAAAGLCDLMVERASVRERSEEPLVVALPGAPLDELLREFLSEILFLFHARKLVASRAEVAVAPGSVTGRLFGEEYDRSRHGGRIEVKGATYHGLAVTRAPDGRLEATVVFDV